MNDETRPPAEAAAERAVGVDAATQLYHSPAPLALDADQLEYLLRYITPRRGLGGEVVVLLDEIVCAGGAA